MVNGAWIIRRGSREGSTSRPAPHEADALALEAQPLLEIDERLAALEREDARRIRELVTRGELHGPAAPASGTDHPSARVR